MSTLIIPPPGECTPNPRGNCCCEIPEDAPCSLKDALVLRLREILDIDKSRIRTSFEEAGLPRVEITDLGESTSSQTGDFRQGERRMRVRVYDKSQANVVNAQSAMVRQVNSLVSKEGCACVHTKIRDETIEERCVWRSQTTLRMTVFEVF